MHTFPRLLVGALIAVGLLSPLMTLAAVVPFGGRVVSAIPCSAGIHFTVVNAAGIGSGAYIWTPGSLTFPWGPPRPGINILGTADSPFVCFFGKIPLFGLRVFMQGTSLTPGV